MLYFPQFKERLKARILNVALDWSFHFFSWWKRWKTRVFQIRLVRDSLFDQSMLFTQLYLMLGEKIEAWFSSSASREYFSVESTAFLSARKFSKKIYPPVRWTAKYVFFISEAMKIACLQIDYIRKLSCLNKFPRHLNAPI